MPTIAYNAFDPSACGFPPPRVPLLPALTGRALRHAAAKEFEMVGAGRARRSYMSGRYALHDAYRLAGVGPEGGLLAPAYHCRTMLDPAISLGATIGLYALDAQLVPDMASLLYQLKAAQRPVRALLLTHYFGFVQNVEPVKRFCDEQGLVLIEDCSHALFNRRGAARVGTSGRYLTASPYKMFPCEDGGLLFAEPGAPLPEVRPAGARAELKALANAAERICAHRATRHGAADIERLDANIAAIMQAPLERGAQAQRNSSATSSLYDVSKEGLSGTRISRGLMSLCDVDRLAQQRRANYRRWSEAVQGVPNCRPLFEQLPDDAVPYMFPLWIDDPHAHFFVLKKLGVPIWRWDDMAASDCTVSQRYREHLLHLPCHQALSDDELAWMTTAVTKVMRHGVSVSSANPF
jgi:perosamine synthetase